LTSVPPLPGHVQKTVASVLGALVHHNKYIGM